MLRYPVLTWRMMLQYNRTSYAYDAISPSTNLAYDATRHGCVSGTTQPGRRFAPLWTSEPPTGCPVLTCKNRYYQGFVAAMILGSFLFGAAEAQMNPVCS
eukprot:2693450-Rhodomonas_salina.2